jgi:hypothetical protein
MFIEQLAPHFPLGFLPLSAAGSQTAIPGGPTMPETEANSPTVSPGGQTTPRTEAGGLSACPGGPTAHGTKAEGPTTTPRRSDHQALCGSFIAYFANFRLAPCGAHDATCSTRGPDVHNSASASHGNSIPTLLTSPSRYVGATGTTSTSVVTASEGCTGGTSGEPPFDGHTGETGLPATNRQSHAIGHLITALSSLAYLNFFTSFLEDLACLHSSSPLLGQILLLQLFISNLHCWDFTEVLTKTTDNFP